MPEEGVALSPASHILTDDEVLRLAKLFVLNGVDKIRLTGGEPTVRASLPDIICTYLPLTRTRRSLTLRSSTTCRPSFIWTSDYSDDFEWYQPP